MLSLQPSGLSVHIFYYNVVNFTERSAVFQYFPRLVRVEMDFDQLLIAHSEKAVPLKVFGKIFTDLIFIEIFSFNEKLSVISEF